MKLMNRRTITVTLLALAALLVFLSLVDIAPPRNMEAEAQSRIESLLGLIAIYTHDKGAPPPADQWSRKAFEFETRSGWEREYAEGSSVPVDPWGNPYQYELVDGNPKLTSAGHDQTFGTQDDISN